MKLSDKGIKALKKHEDVRYKAYICPAGKLTIGVGHKVLDSDNIKLNDVISDKRVDELLRADVTIAELEVLRMPKSSSLTQGMFDALVSFTFNVGLGNFRSSTLRKKVIKDKYDRLAVGTQFARWVYGGGKKLKGLITRRRDEFQRYCEID